MADNKEIVNLLSRIRVFLICIALLLAAATAVTGWMAFSGNTAADKPETNVTEEAEETETTVDPLAIETFEKKSDNAEGEEDENAFSFGEDQETIPPAAPNNDGGGRDSSQNPTTNKWH